MKKLIAVAIVAIAGFGSCTMAQSVPNKSNYPVRDCQARLNAILTSEPNLKDQRIEAALNPSENAPCFAEVLLRKSPAVQGAIFEKLIQAYQQKRNDKQEGSSAGTSTSLVSKGLTAQAISLAAEYGALTQSVNKQVVTVSGSLGGFATALVHQNLFLYCPSGKDLPLGANMVSKENIPKCLNRATLNGLKRFSYGVSFDTSANSEAISGSAAGQPSGTAQPVTFTAARHQITAWNGRYVLVNTRVGDSEFQKLLNDALTAKDNADATALKAAGQQLMTSFSTFLGSPSLVPENSTVVSKVRAQMLDHAGAQMRQATTAPELDARFDAWTTEYIAIVQNDKDILVNISKYLQDYSAYNLAQDELTSAIGDKPVLAFEYNNNRPVGQDPTSTFRLIFDKGFGKWSITANGAATIYDTRPQLANVTRWRDAQVGFQVQYDLGKALSVPAAFSAAYYFQYQNGPAILNVTP
jgi:hypothetical protein